MRYSICLNCNKTQKVRLLMNLGLYFFLTSIFLLPLMPCLHETFEPLSVMFNGKFTFEKSMVKKTG